VSSISNNAFQNCPEFEILNYNGKQYAYKGNAAHNSNYLTNLLNTFVTNPSNSNLWPHLVDTTGNVIIHKNAVFFKDGTSHREHCPVILNKKSMTGLITLWCAKPTKSIPANALLCNGASVSKQTYDQLFDVIGTQYGSTDTEFNLPNFETRVPIGRKNDNYGVNHIYTENDAYIGGTQLTNAQFNHNHTIDLTGITKNLNTVDIEGGNVDTFRSYKEDDISKDLSYSSRNSSSSTDLYPPFQVLKYIIYT